jgi:hypothetical protein
MFHGGNLVKFKTYSHRAAEIIINSDYAIRLEIEDIIRSITISDILVKYDSDNDALIDKGKKKRVGLQPAINNMFRERFSELHWEREKHIFDNDEEDNLKIDFWKREIGVDVAFVNRGYIGGDLLRLQAAGEVANIIKLGVYICPTTKFRKTIYTNQSSSSMVSFEKTLWYLKNLSPVLTVPIWLIGLED